MNEQEVIEITQQAIILIVQISTPIMIIGLIVGVAIALIQALTQIQEMTLSFVPKMIAIYLSIFLLLPAMMAMLISFMEVIADRIISIG